MYSIEESEWGEFVIISGILFSVTVILLHCGSFSHKKNKILVCVNMPGNKADSDSNTPTLIHKPTVIKTCKQ